MWVIFFRLAACAPFALVLTLLAGWRPAAAAAAAPSRAEFCPISISSIVPLDGASAPANRFAAVLVSQAGTASVSGSLRVNASGASFRVRFTNRIAVPVKPAPAAADRIEFTLPEPVRLENAYVDSLDDPQRPCPIANVWTPQFALLQAGLPSLPTQAAPITATPLAGDTCTEPPVPTIVRRAVPPDIPPLAMARGITGEVEIDVELGADSAVRSTRVARSASGTLNAEALRSARSSIYQTAIEHCRPVPSVYRFIVEFQRQ